MTLLRNNAEGQNDGTAVATAQSGSGDAFSTAGTSGSATATYSEDHAFHGTQSYKVTTTATAGDLAYFGYSSGNNQSAAIRFYLYLSSSPASAIQIAGLRNASSGVVAINLNSTTKIQLVDTSGASIGAFTSALSTGVWYRVELGVTIGAGSTGSCSLAYYVGESTTAVESPLNFSGQDLASTNITTVRFGKITSTAAACTLYMDDLAYRDGSPAFIGPDPVATGAWFTA